MKRLIASFLLFPALALCAEGLRLDAPESVGRFDVAEFSFFFYTPPAGNPFTDATVEGDFVSPAGVQRRVIGFADSQDGRVFRLRFSPDQTGSYQYHLRLQAKGVSREWHGRLKSVASQRPGPVIVDPVSRKHFLHQGSREPFYHVGFTAYHLVDPSNDDAQVDATIDYCARLGFNKVRFLLAGYPRDTDTRTSTDNEHGVPDPWKRKNYGAIPGRVNALPAWIGEPHNYDFTRFNTAHWQRIDRAVQRMRERGIVATAIVTIEKQDLPKEYGRLTEHEYRLYRYAVARLGAFENVWWDLGNEHNEYRDAEWGNTMGAFVKSVDAHRRLVSAHAYADFWYSDSDWADFIITQQYGDEQAVNEWALKHLSVPKPYVNEEYGYEGNDDSKFHHGLNADMTRRAHWSIAMAGGYGTYGDWSEGVSYFYMGVPGPGVGAGQLGHLRRFFEALPFRRMRPANELTSAGFGLVAPSEHYVFYLPRGGQAEVDLSGYRSAAVAGWWVNPRTGEWRSAGSLVRGKNFVSAPDGGDWVLYAGVGGRR
ncbi:MAG: DUF4038 domain-containing protein [Bryobacteraceae bacterium]